MKKVINNEILWFTALIGANLSFIFLYYREITPKIEKWIIFKENLLKKEFEEMRKQESINIEETITEFSGRLNEIRELKNRLNQVTYLVIWSVLLAILMLPFTYFEQEMFVNVLVSGSGIFFGSAFLYAISDIRNIHRWEISTKSSA